MYLKSNNNVLLELHAYMHEVLRLTVCSRTELFNVYHCCSGHLKKIIRFIRRSFDYLNTFVLDRICINRYEFRMVLCT